MRHQHVANSDSNDRPSQLRVRALFPSPRHSRPPIHWWRTRRPQSFDRSDAKAIRAHLLHTQSIIDVDWLRAVTGDPSIAIGVAIRQLNSYGMTSSIIDAAVSAVLCCAIEGDAAARALIESALRRRSKIDPLCTELVLAWRAIRF